MHTNTKLMIAIGAALSLSTPPVFAAGDFKTVTDLTKVGSLVLPINLTANGFDVLSTAAPAASSLTIITNGLSTTEGITYAEELFDSGNSPEQLPSGTNYIGVHYTTDGTIESNFTIIFSLDNGASFANTYLYATNDANIASIDSTATKGEFDVKLNAATTLPADTFFLAYQIASAGALGEGKVINMTATVRTGLQNEEVINPDRIVQIASASQAISANIAPQNEGIAKISVGKANTEFTGPIPDTGAYIDQRNVEIGLLELSDGKSLDAGVIVDDQAPFDSDGETSFTIGSKDGTITSATLEITEGQFAASQTSSATVFIDQANVKATTVTALDENNSTTATFELTDDHLKAIVNGILNNDGAPLGIRYTVDGATEINIPENEPCAYLEIDFEESYVKDIRVPEEGCIALRKIPQDGTTCYVYVVPKPVSDGARDALSILITNNTSQSDQVLGTFYQQEGGDPLFENVPLVDVNGNDILEAKKTMRISGEELKTLAGASWTGRGWLKLRTTLSNIEVLSLLRDVPSNINSNVSVGASGSACSN